MSANMTDGPEGIALIAGSRTLSTAARVLEVVAVGYGLAGAVGGIVLATHTVPAAADAANQTARHPFVASGIGVAVTALVTAAFLWAIARTANVIGAYVGARTAEALPPTGTPTIADRPEPVPSDPNRPATFTRVIASDLRPGMVLPGESDGAPGRPIDRVSRSGRSVIVRLDGGSRFQFAPSDAVQVVATPRDDG